MFTLFVFLVGFKVYHDGQLRHWSCSQASSLDLFPGSCAGEEEREPGGFEVRNDIALTVTVCIASFKTIGKPQRERCSSHVPCHLARTNVDNSCK